MSAVGHRDLLLLAATTTAAQLRPALEAGGFRLRHVTDAEAALDALVEAPPDAVCLEDGPVEADAWALVAALRRVPRTRRTPVVLLAPMPEVASIARRGAPAGVVLLGGPVEPDNVVHTLQALTGI